MNTLRWLLAVGLVLAGSGLGAFLLLANNFRCSFGASENNLLIAVIPVILSLAAAWWLLRKTCRAVAANGTLLPSVARGGE